MWERSTEFGAETFESLDFAIAAGELDLGGAEHFLEHLDFLDFALELLGDLAHDFVTEGLDLALSSSQQSLLILQLPMQVSNQDVLLLDFFFALLRLLGGSPRNLRPLLHLPRSAATLLYRLSLRAAFAVLCIGLL